MLIYIGLDDTDNAESRGTGRLARAIADDFSETFSLMGVIRHQLLVDPRVPYTSHNSSACILLEAGAVPDLPATLGQIMTRARSMMEADFQPGSDPGLCVSAEVPVEISAFGRRAQHEVVSQQEARQLAEKYGLKLAGLGGSEDGVIGALAAVGLAASGEDGRYIQVGTLRTLSGLQTVETLLQSGIARVCLEDGILVTSGLVQAEKLRPARRGSQPVQFVTWQDDTWLPVKLD